MSSRFLSIMKTHLSAHRGSLLLYVLIKISMFSVAIVGPLLFGRYLDAMLSNTGIGLYAKIALAFIALSATASLLKYASEVLNTKIDATLTFLASQAAIKEYFKSSLEALARFESAYMSSRVISDSRSLIVFALNNVVDGALALAQGILMLCLVARKSALMFLAICAILPLCALAFSAYRKKMADMARTTKEVAAQYSAANQKQCADYLFIKLNGLIDISRAFVRGYFRDTLSGFLAYKKMAASLDLIIALLQLGCTAFLLLVGGGQVQAKRMSVGTFTAINAYFIALVAIVSGLVVSARALVDARESLKRMDAVLGQDREVGADLETGAVDAISVHGLSVGVDAGKSVLKGFSKEFRAGRRYCVVGQNGSGKSTLLKALCGGYASYEGDILINGADIRQMDIEKLRRGHIAYLPQSPVLFFETLNDLYSMGGALTEGDQLNRLLKSLLFVDDPAAFIEERLRDNGSSVESRFSGGERQKIAFASACARENEVLLLDEPSSSLDDRSRRAVAEILKGLPREKLIICVSHDELLMEEADEIVRI
jgi:ATP-binding cassette, subfamily B, bacterial